jgi:hypothetical protein
MPLMGNLRQFALPSVLRAIETGQRTGRLRLTRGEMEGAIYFSSGQLLLVERGGFNYSLAQQFLRIGLISREQIENATGLPAERAETLPDVQAVRALITARILTQDQLRKWAEDDAQTMLVSVFGWTDGDFLFEEGVLSPGGRIALPLPIGPLIEKAQRHVRNTTVRNPPLLAPETVVGFADVDPEGDAIRISLDQWSLLTYVDGQTSLLAISQSMGQPELAVMRLASQLADAGILEVVPGR